jgi:hypothetical protein
MPIPKKRGMVRDLLIESQTREPARSQVHPHVLNQAALTGDSVQVPNQENA